MVNAKRKKPPGLLQPLDIPIWKWEYISMDFVDGLPKTRRGNESIWVIVDMLTKSAHFIPLPATRDVRLLCDRYIKEVVRLHGVPLSLSLIHISEPTRRTPISYAVFCLKK